MPLLSIVVPIYKVEAWLEDCIRSVKAQSFSDWECILVDDGSPDGCPAICDAAAADDPRFRVVHKQNGGLSSARNAGIQAACGRWVLFLDADDCIAPQLTGYACQLQQQQPEAMVTFPLTEEKAAFQKACQKPVSHTASSYRALSWRDTQFVNACTRLYDLDFLKKQGLLFDETLGFANSPGEDVEFNKRYLPARWPEGDFPVLLIDQPLYYYRLDNEHSIMHEKRRLEAQQGEQKTLPPPESGYCAALLTECEAALSTFKSGEDPDGLRMYALHFLRCMAFGIWSAKQLGEPLPKGLFQHPALCGLLDICKTHHIYSGYYLPFRMRAKGLLRKLYQWDQTGSIWYWRFYEIFYRLFCRGWKR